MTSTIAAYGLPVRTPTAYDRRRAAVRQAAQVIAFDDVVVLGVESDPATGRVYEVAAIDTVGRMLIDTLVNPGVSIASKNLTDQMLAGAPTFGQVFADLLIHAGRKAVATYTSWNQSAILRRAHQHYRDAGPLNDPSSWYLVAQARSEWLGQPSHYLPLQPYHRALSEAHAALNVIRTIAADER
jgi:hypothetical protein